VSAEDTLPLLVGTLCVTQGHRSVTSSRRGKVLHQLNLPPSFPLGFMGRLLPPSAFTPIGTKLIPHSSKTTLA